MSFLNFFILNLSIVFDFANYMHDCFYLFFKENDRIISIDKLWIVLLSLFYLPEENPP